MILLYTSYIHLYLIWLYLYKWSIVFMYGIIDIFSCHYLSSIDCLKRKRHDQSISLIFLSIHDQSCDHLSVALKFHFDVSRINVFLLNSTTFLSWYFTGFSGVILRLDEYGPSLKSRPVTSNTAFV